MGLYIVHRNGLSPPGKGEYKMARYILIDSNSGFIWGDTATLPAFDGGAPDCEEAIVSAARVLDESVGSNGREYEYRSRDPRTSESYYRVYRADVDGSEAVPVIEDGQDGEMIEAVERDCEFVGVVVLTEVVD